MTPAIKAGGTNRGHRPGLRGAPPAAAAGLRPTSRVLYRVLPNELALGQDFLGAEA